MESSSIIIGIICIALFLVPIYLLSRSTAQKKKKRLEALLAFAGKNALRLTTTDAWSEYAIGTDGRYVLYVKSVETNHEEILIDLQEIARCSINTVAREFKNGNTTQRLTERLELQFFPEKPEKAVVVLEFYDSHAHVQLSGELQLAEKWVKLVKNAL